MYHKMKILFWRELCKMVNKLIDTSIYYLKLLMPLFTIFGNIYEAVKKNLFLTI